MSDFAPRLFDPDDQSCDQDSARSSGTITVAKLAEEFLADGIDGDPDTVRWYRYIFFSSVGLATKFGEMPAAEITEREIKQWIGSRKLAPSTQRTYVNAARVAFRWGKRVKLLEEDPLPSRISTPPMESRKPMGSENFREILRHSDGWLKRILFGLYFTGARPSEVCKLRFEDIDVDGNIAHIQYHKTKRHGHTRKIAIHPKMKRLIEWCKRNAFPGQTHVFINTRGQPWNAVSIRSRIYRIKKRFNLPDHVTTYGLRHEFGSDALRAGLDLATVGELMGHTNLATTKKYVHADDDGHLREAIQSVR